MICGQDRHTSVKLAEHQIEIAEMRRLVNAERAKVIELPDVLRECSRALSTGLSNAYFKSLGLPSLFQSC